MDEGYSVKNKELVNSFEDELHKILSFWLTQMPDEKFGGFYGRITGKGDLKPYADKGVILNTRILWTFSAVQQVVAGAKYTDLAKRAYEYLIKHFLDFKRGGVFWMLDHKGRVIENKKQIYAQAFAIYALTEYYKIDSNSNALNYAIDLFKLIEHYGFDQHKNGYFEAFSSSWEHVEDVRLSEKDMNGQKTMNTHLHILEAYTNLYRVWPDKELKEQLSNLIKLMSKDFLYPSGHFKLFFSADWELLSHEVSYGHDIEGSWLLWEAVEVLKEEGLTAQIQPIILKMVEAAMEGLDQDGALMNEGKPEGEVTDTDKHWWPQAEALVGFINANQITGNQDFLRLTERIWHFIQSRMLDPTGEWYWCVNREGSPQLSEDKAGPWKCPYHNGRAMMEAIRRLT